MLHIVVAIVAALAAETRGIVSFAGQPVPGATVTAVRHDARVTTFTDAGGRYRFDRLAEGVWTVEVEITGFVTERRDVSVRHGDSAPIIWELTMKPAALLLRERPEASPAAKAPPRTARLEAAVPRDDPPGDAADGFVVNGSVNNAAASPFAQPRAFGNNRPQTGARYSGSAGLAGGTSKWDARPFPFGAASRGTAEYHDLRVLATFGGPARLPRLDPNAARFFVGYQGTSDHAASSTSAVVPTLLERRGDFSRSVDASGRPVRIRDPRTGELRDTLPQELLSPQAIALLAYFPEPNGNGTGRHNYPAPVVRATRQDSLQFRWTHVRGRNIVGATGAYQRTVADATSMFGFEDRRRDADVDAAVNWTRRFTRTLAARLRYQYTRLSHEVTPHFSFRSNVSGDAGIAGNDQAPRNWGPPRIVFPDIATLSAAEFQSSRAATHAIGLETYLNRGRHTITIGGNVRRHRHDQVVQQDARGSLVFTGAATGVPFADFLVGIPTVTSISFGDAPSRLRSSSFDLYANDDARLTSTLTATFGVRWEYEAPFVESAGRLANLEVSPGFETVAPVIASVPTGPLTGDRLPESLVHPDRTGFQPRVALAWRPVAGSSLVVRAGYGVYRNTGVYLPIATLLAQQPPLAKAFRLTNSMANLRTLDNAFVSVPPGISNTFAVDPDFKAGIAQNWQVSVQRDLPASLLATATYLGSRGSRLPHQFLPNTYPAGRGNPCPSCPVGFVYLASTGTSSRHAGRVLLRRRLRGGLAASVEYTLARAADDASMFTSASASGTAVAQNWLDLEAERAPSDFDQRHHLSVDFEYTTGAGRTAMSWSAWRSALLRGWTLSTQLTAGSGLPLTPVHLAPIPGTGIVGVRPDLTGVAVDAAPSGFYVNPAAFAPPAAGQWGSAGRNSIRGPAAFSCDASLARVFGVGERFSLEWRIDATNVLNRVTYTAIGTIVGTPQFGRPTAASPMRKVQTSLRLRF